MDMEKVIKGLDVCLKNIDQPDCPNDCPYFSDCSEYENGVVFQLLMRDALALLKEDCHNCKLECLLQKYDELKEKYDKLLKEQDAIEPRTDDAWPSRIKTCGACGTCLFAVGDYKPKYCSECGRRVKWK